MADDDVYSSMSPLLRQAVTQRLPRDNRTLEDPEDDMRSSPVPPVVRATAPRTRSTNVTWSSLGTESTGTPIPEVGGLYKDPDGKIIPFVGTDPDARVNVFSYSESLNDWECDVTIFHHTFTNKQ